MPRAVAHEMLDGVIAQDSSARFSRGCLQQEPMNDRLEEIDLTSIGSIRILQTVAVLALNLTAAGE
jgi:hypothetical protein